MASRLDIGFELDRRWHLLRGEMDSSKKPDLLAVATILATAGARYAIIGGVALQIHQAEPCTTLDIELAVHDVGALPDGGWFHQNRRIPPLGELGRTRRHPRPVLG